jgi:thiosulfate reductase cytochrome b subunit
MRIHPLPVRITHWTNAVAMTVMIASGWPYNASPLFAFTFPAWLTLGHWLGGALAWHFAAMWLLAGNFAFYLGYGLLGGHIGRRLFPLRPHDVWRDAAQALHFRLPHDSTHYNAVQRLQRE